MLPYSYLPGHVFAPVRLCREAYKRGELDAAVNLVTNALHLYAEDPKVLRYAEKLSHKLKLAAAADAGSN